MTDLHALRWIYLFPPNVALGNEFIRPISLSKLSYISATPYGWKRIRTIERMIDSDNDRTIYIYCLHRLFGHKRKSRNQAHKVAIERIKLHSCARNGCGNCWAVEIQDESEVTDRLARIALMERLRLCTIIAAIAAESYRVVTYRALNAFEFGKPLNISEAN
eukprot:scaffold61103_cov38-Attheya_sp.AAC.2